MENIIGRTRNIKNWELEVVDKEGTHYEILATGLKRGEVYSYWLYFHPLTGIKIWEGYGKIPPKYVLNEVYKLMKDVSHTTKKYVNIKDKYDNLVDVFTL